MVSNNGITDEFPGAWGYQTNWRSARELSSELETAT